MIISDNEIDIPWAKKEIKEIGYELVSTRVNLMRKRIFPFWKIIRYMEESGKMRRCC